MSKLTCDFGLTAKDYAQHRAGFPAWFFDRLLRQGIELTGKRVLDLGTGTGLLAKAMARRGAIVTGIDISREMLEAARASELGQASAIKFMEAAAEATGAPDSSFDLVTAATCWHWFDRSRAAKEAARVLVEGGAILLCSLDWLPLPGNVVAATETLVRKHNPAWSLHDGDGLKPAYVWDLRASGFSRIECFGTDCRIEYSHDGWRGRMRASAGVAASLPSDAVAAFDADLAAMLARDFPQEPLAVDHCVFAAMGWKVSTQSSK